MDSKIFTASEAAEFLGAHVETIRRVAGMILTKETSTEGRENHYETK